MAVIGSIDERTSLPVSITMAVIGSIDELVVLGAFGVLMMAASAPPNYSELHADNGKGAKKVLWRKRSKLPIRQHVATAGTGRRMNLYNHAHNTQHTHVHTTPSLASMRPHAPPSSAVDMLSDVTSALQRDLSASYTSGGGHRSMDMDMDALGMCDTDGYEEEEGSSKTNLYSESEELEIGGWVSGCVAVMGG
ncbi:hypothetical protein SARC_10906 [Sphaeroforma arctica JP610]|uniref:Uncharacterized protein n=1 Tax=Sphaeroforma arctica JP610 TaxID=667725 RepID=A0A0L0FIN2_9EUKA|nr:hypothetical protein SARC_10906 [Sphaeroforma arctica JP610]KNC76600.1 hypothetical protein SARC_10906 [Sphaeroforma arctica JP610]|eukprot:XP_014150502.1 hypothetical protein SARC_10906 [Sphaeroforma arctica JP610]